MNNNNENELNPQGYVTILPVKEKMYPLKQLKELFDSYGDNIPAKIIFEDIKNL